MSSRHVDEDERERRRAANCGEHWRELPKLEMVNGQSEDRIFKKN